MPEVMIVTVHQALGCQIGLGEICVTGSVKVFVEEPVGRSAMKPVAAIGIEGGSRPSIQDGLGDPGIPAQVPCFIEVDVG